MLKNLAKVSLISGTGSKSRGGGKGEFYWHIFLEDKRVGYIFINNVNHPPFGLHHAISIHINISARSQGIGSKAFKLACEESHYSEIHAYMKKSNKPSFFASKNAGFLEVENSSSNQRTMLWKRIKETASTSELNKS